VFLTVGVACPDFDEAIANTADVIGRGTFGCERKIGFLVLMVPEVNANGGFAHGSVASLLPLEPEGMCRCMIFKGSAG
jgi:hypothetical protein